jgi:FAD/FMN-containing dehydrogenase
MIDQFGPDALNLMKLIKKTMDPNNILNPGKIF